MPTKMTGLDERLRFDFDHYNYYFIYFKCRPNMPAATIALLIARRPDETMRPLMTDYEFIMTSMLSSSHLFHVADAVRSTAIQPILKRH